MQTRIDQELRGGTQKSSKQDGGVVALGEELNLISPLVKPWSYGYKLVGCFSLVDLKFFLKINIFKKELKFCSYF